MNFDANTVQLFCAVLGAVLAYTFGRFQHKKEYKENLKAQIFGDLLTMRLTQFVGAGYGIPNIRNTSYCVCTNHRFTKCVC